MSPRDRDLRVCERAVAQGADLLDRKNPGWAKGIDTQHLDIGSADHCICGQLYGSFRHGTAELGVTDDSGEYGFAQPSGVSGTNAAYWEMLNSIWIGTIEARIMKSMGRIRRKRRTKARIA
jgi:hypothetical protein